MAHGGVQAAPDPAKFRRREAVAAVKERPAVVLRKDDLHVLNQEESRAIWVRRQQLGKEVKSPDLLQRAIQGTLAPGPGKRSAQLVLFDELSRQLKVLAGQTQLLAQQVSPGVFPAITPVSAVPVVIASGVDKGERGVVVEEGLDYEDDVEDIRPQLLGTTEVDAVEPTKKRAQTRRLPVCPQPPAYHLTANIYISNALILNET